ncbi:unnamed protein product [Boreogadus saida]
MKGVRRCYVNHDYINQFPRVIMFDEMSSMLSLACVSDSKHQLLMKDIDGTRRVIIRGCFRSDDYEPVLVEEKQLYSGFWDVCAGNGKSNAMNIYIYINIYTYIERDINMCSFIYFYCTFWAWKNATQRMKNITIKTKKINTRLRDRMRFTVLRHLMEKLFKIGSGSEMNPERG